MNPSDRDKLSAAETRARDAVRTLGRPLAHSAFRERLKREFVSGTVPELARLPVEHPVPWYRRFGLLSLGAAAAAAAVLVIALLGQGPRWELGEPIPGGALVMNDIEIPLGDAHAVNRYLKAGVRVARDDSTMINLVSPERMVVQLAPYSEVVLPSLRGREMRAQVTRGEVRFSTGPEFAGSRLLIDTEIARVELLGSTIAVITGDVGTCVCVYDGSVPIGPLDGELVSVPVGKRKILHKDGRPDLIEDLEPMERMKLQMLQDAAFPGAD